MSKFIIPLLWKSLCIRKRHYVYTFLEFVLPLSMYALLLCIKSNLPNRGSVLVGNSTFQPKSREQIFQEPYKNNWDYFDIVFSPNATATLNIMKEVEASLKRNRYTIGRMKAVNSESEVEKIFFQDYGNDSSKSGYKMAFGVIFNSTYSYSLRPVSNTILTSSLFGAFPSPGPGSQFIPYLTEGFVLLQICINDAIFNQFRSTNNKTENTTNFSMTELPYPSYHNDDAFSELSNKVISLFTVFGYNVLVPSLISTAIEEKKSGSREWMRLVGISKFMILLSWVLHSMIIYFFTTLINSVLLKVYIGGSPILSSTNFFVVWIVLFLFCTSTVLFMLSATSFINNPNVAVMFGCFLWVLPPVVNNYSSATSVSFAVKLLTCFFPTITLDWAFIALRAYEANNEEITFTNLFKMHSGQRPDISLGLSIVCFCVAIIVYSLLFLYIDSVKPGEFGRARSWNFIFEPLLKLFKNKDLEVKPMAHVKNRANFEDLSNNLAVGLSFHGINKKFGSVTAVEDVTIDIYKGQLTALLGHNGAGKTTLINIITGMFSPTKGAIWKDGNNVFENFQNFQKTVGLCPQNNLLFPYLSVSEHVIFFGMLRGLSVKKASSDSKDLLRFFGISDKANSLTKKLSGGMKRKLSLSISLIGDPEILILDEPTSGMDPESRRDTWNKLLTLRGDRTIILTTHYMEEADVLGDKIAIMDHGVIKCYGSSLYLKRQYGSGYKVTVPYEYSEMAAEVVASLAPECLSSLQVGSAVSYSLPLEKRSLFGDIFSKLEKNLSSHGARIHVSCTTIDDVFLKVVNSAPDEVDNSQVDKDCLLNISLKGDDIHSSSEALTAPKADTGLALQFNRLSALFRKKMLYNYHHWTMWLFLTIFYPFISLLIPLMLTTLILKSEFSAPSLSMDLNIYGDTEVMISKLSGNNRFETLINLVKDQHSNPQVINDTSINTALLNAGTENLSKYRSSYIVAFNLSSNIPNIFYSSIGFHSPPIAVNLFYNALLGFNDMKLITYNHPFNFKEDICGDKFVSMQIVAVPPMIWLFTAPMVVAVICYSFSRLHHDERLNSGKLLQLMTGTSPVLYWLSAFLCDIILLLISVCFILLEVYLLDSAKLFSSSSAYGLLFLALMLSGISCLWFGYLMSNFLVTFSRLFSLNILFSFFFGDVTKCVLIFLNLIDLSSSAINTISVFHHILMLFPSYSSSSLIYKLIKHLSLYAIIKKCNLPIGPDGVLQDDIFSWNNDGIYKELTYLACDWIIFASMILLIDFGIFRQINNYILNLYVGDTDSVFDRDVDVANEKLKVAEINRSGIQSSIIVDSLSKKYSRKFTAVKDVSFLVSKGECFGLLGVNGAGKSTTFKMLTGDLLPTKGRSIVFGDSLNENKSKYHTHIGYCPQTDAIIGALTGTEMLKLFASLRGVNPTVFNRAISFWISEFGLESICNRRCESYSGGNKRKLSTAISLIGDPQVVFLDEPTTGVDPVARRKFWAILSKLQKKGCTIIITSHSMDECETVCDRLTIMAKGEMKCIGSIQRLKEKYGQGFTVIVQLEQHSDSQLNSLKSDFQEKFSPHAILRDENIGLLHYHINSSTCKWSALFSTMENIKDNNSIIKDYVITETSLEQIFLYFAKQ